MELTKKLCHKNLELYNIDLFGASFHFINLIVQIGIISSRAEFNVRAAPFGGQDRVCSYRSYRMNLCFQGVLKDA